jgi:hypothetical protein
MTTCDAPGAYLQFPPTGYVGRDWGLALMTNSEPNPPVGPCIRSQTGHLARTIAAGTIGVHCFRILLPARARR